VKRLRTWGLALLCAAPACYTGSARDVSSEWLERARSDKSWQIVSDVPFVAQKSDADCGPAALAMVLGHFGVSATLDQVTALDPPSDGGVRAGALRDVARGKGLEAFVVSGTLSDIVAQLDRGRPILVGLAKPMVGGRAIAHYEVVVGMNRPKRLILSFDPSRGPRQNSFEGFAREWVPTHQVTIVIFAGLSGLERDRVDQRGNAHRILGRDIQHDRPGAGRQIAARRLQGRVQGIETRGHLQID
jgi:hypothetical protein